jgi:hypothetical protein
MGCPLNLKMFFPNDAMTVVFMREKNVRSSGMIGVFFQKRRKKLYENRSRLIMSSLLKIKNLAKGL